MQKLLSLGILVMLLLGWSCTEEDSETTVLVTEEVLYTSGEQVRLLGRLITDQAIDVIDHGFYLSLEESFSSPIIISLGAKKGPGRFIGQATGLAVSKSYYAKAFMDVGGETQFGNVLELSTQNPAVESFSPAFGSPNEEMVILGRNFTRDTKVFFGDQPATILEIQFESRMRVRIPAPKTSAIVPLTVQVQDKVLTLSGNFEYQIGTYTKLGNFPDPVWLYDNLFFQNASGFYIGLGSESKLRFYQKFQRYNPATSSWEAISFPGSPRVFGFSTQNYLGGGARELGRDPYLINRTFWKINENGFQQLPDLAFDSRESVAFELLGKLYVAGGKEGDPSAIRRFDPLTNSWSNLPGAPIFLTAELANFTYQNRHYFVNSDKVIWAFDPAANTWINFDFYPDSLGEGYGMAQVIGNKVYIGLYRKNQTIWELDLITKKWTRKNSIPGIPQTVTVGHFEKEGKIYLMRAIEFNLATSFPMEFYRFDPNGI